MAGRPGWPHLLYACLLHSLHSALVYVLSIWSLRHGLQLIENGESAVRAVADTGFFGLAFLLRWLTLTATLLWGRRRFTAELEEVRACLEQMARAGLPGLATFRRRTRRLAAALWVVMVALAIGIAWATSANITHRSRSWQQFVMLWMTKIGYMTMVCCFQLVPVKFLFAGQLISAGLEALNAELQDMVGGRRPAGRWELQQVAQLRERLTDSLTRLTSDMRSELILAMAAGVLLLVSLFSNTLIVFQTGVTTTGIVNIMVFTASMALTLAGPCEAGQQLLMVTTSSRRLLLQLESRRPQLARQAALLREAAAQDLDTLGDLGLFRLRRSTLLSVASTILTYVIIMLQFGENSPDPAAAQATGNATGNPTETP